METNTKKNSCFLENRNDKPVKFKENFTLKVLQDINRQKIRIFILAAVAEQVKLEFAKSHDLLIEQARIMQELLVGDLPAFTLEFPEINDAFAHDFLDAIDLADGTLGDNSVVTTQHLATLSADQVMALGRRRLRRLFVYGRNIYEDDPELEANLEDLGEREFIKARTNKTKVKDCLELSYAK